MAYGNPQVAATAEELLQRNQDISKSHEPIAYFDERPPGAPLPKVFICKQSLPARVQDLMSTVCCFDPRVDPVKFLGLNPWDALVIRNVGGNVTSQMQNLVFVDHLLGSFTDIFIIQHTNCGATLAKNVDVRARLNKENLGAEPEIDDLWLPGYNDIEKRVHDNVKIIKTSPFVRKELKDHTQGFIYDLKTGRLINVK